MLNGDAGTMWYQMWINTKVFRDAGIVDSSGNVKIPETAEDVLAAAAQIRSTSNGKVYGWGLGGKEDFPWALQSQIGQLSGVYGYDGIDNRTGKFTYSTNPVYNDSSANCIGHFNSWFRASTGPTCGQEAYYRYDSGPNVYPFWLYCVTYL
jgi:ABC-type glycerol-3-phosphate transport system substrate-binding protein